MRRRLRSVGMTLIEVMVSMAVLSMIVVSIWSSFKGTLRGMETSEEIQLKYSIIRSGLTRLSSELSMAYLSFNRPLHDTRHYTLFEGRDNSEEDSVTFSAYGHLRIRKDANESDQSVIQYFLLQDPEDSDRTHLYRRETRRLTGDLPEQLEEYAQAYVVIEDVASFDVQYWDNRQQEWLDEWRTTAVDSQPDRLPDRVVVKLGVKDTDGEITFFNTQVELLMQERVDLGKT